jgi:hypothetical protein
MVLPTSHHKRVLFEMLVVSSLLIKIYQQHVNSSIVPHCKESVTYHCGARYGSMTSPDLLHSPSLILLSSLPRSSPFSCSASCTAICSVSIHNVWMYVYVSSCYGKATVTHDYTTQSCSASAEMQTASTHCTTLCSSSTTPHYKL